MNTINKLAEKVHQNAKNKGFHDDEKNIGEMLCLIHSEVSEALEADRIDNYIEGVNIKIFSTAEKPGITWENLFEAAIKNTFEDELADIMIRVMDLAALKGIDLDSHIAAKMRYNETRPTKHGKKY
ncbi:MAG: hypothetical protein IMY67_11240 [Bacteroidetes bacterium]|nr:hypothetical protein [Bacteroidota bacterium]